MAGLDTEGSKQRSASQSSLDKLDQELKVSVCANVWPPGFSFTSGQLLIGIIMPLLTPHALSFLHPFY